MKRLALRCMCELLKNHYQFNLADTLSKAIIPFALSSYSRGNGPTVET